MALNVKTQDLENRQVEMTVEVPEDRFRAAMQAAARRLAKDVKIPGFRPGKAPYEVILNKVGHEAIFEEALDGLGQEMYREAIKESDLNPYAPGTLEEIVSQDPLVLRFTVPLEPNVELGDYQKVRVPFETPEVSDEEFEKVLEEIRQSRALIEPADRPAQMSDVVIIDVTSELKAPEAGEDTSIMDMKGTEILLSEDARWPIQGIAEHHMETGNTSIWGYLVSAADAVSSARPGARRETLDNYLKRLKDLEDIANSFTGVEKSYAIQAGREVRILVKPEEIDDVSAMRLARDIVKKIEEGMEYPGQIKVTVVRETRAVEIAK